MLKFKNNVVIVTGSGRGIGRAIALEFAKEGAHVVVNVNRSVQEGEEVVKEIKVLGGRSIMVQADVAETAEAEKLIKTSIDHFGKVDILVNNSGTAKPAMCHKMTEEQWDTVIAVNLKGTFNCIRAVAQHMIDRKAGRIINMSSIAGKDGFIGNINYSGSKGGIDAMTVTAARELGRYGITVNAIAPGIIETTMTEWLKDEKLREKYLQKISLGRFGKPEDVARVALFLASDDSQYLTGQIFRVDGGTF